MAFEGLAERLQAAFKKLRGKGVVTESDVNEAMREVRLALLEADVNFKVVKDFIAKVKERALGQEVMKSLTPGQQVIKVVHDELTALMGSQVAKIQMAERGPTVIMMVGLQGAGKTTTAGKLAKYLTRQNRRPLLVAADIYRPAAIRQLQVLGEQLALPVFTLGQQADPVHIVKGALAHAKDTDRDIIIIDTAGRLHVDDELMAELEAMKEVAQPHEILLVVDAMTGQDAVNVAEAFHQKLSLTGVILTKLDGDTRGGAALSVKAVTGCPIKFVGMGERLDALEPFHPDRMASRILGMGDVLTLIEKAQQAVDAEKAAELEQKLRKAEFTLDDFLEQLQQIKSMGPLDELMRMMPGFERIKGAQSLTIDERQLKRVEAIIQSMTPEERRNPQIINASRRRRIADGSGNSIQDVNRLLKQFEDMKKMMKQMGNLTRKKRKRKGLFKGFPF